MLPEPPARRTIAGTLVKEIVIPGYAYFNNKPDFTRSFQPIISGGATIATAYEIIGAALTGIEIAAGIDPKVGLLIYVAAKGFEVGLSHISRRGRTQ